MNQPDQKVASIAAAVAATGAVLLFRRLVRNRRSEKETQLYDFDTPVDRSNVCCVKWEFAPKVCPAIMKAVQWRAAHATFGYTLQPEVAWEGLRHWLSTRHKFNVQREDLIFTPNLVGSTVHCIHAFSKPGDSIIVFTPLYYPLQKAVSKSGRDLVRIPLRLDVDSMRYQLPLEEVRRTIAEKKPSMLVLCNPHNPSGRVWRREELEALGRLCAENGVLIVSDEVHCELNLWQLQHVPMAIAAQGASVVTTMSPSKTWNLAGLKCAFVVITDPSLRKAYMSVVEHAHGHFGGTFATVALATAYSEGECEVWRRAVVTYIESNVTFLEGYLKEHLPDIVPMIPDASFLVWLDCTRLGLDTEGGDKSELCRFVRSAGLFLSAGHQFGPDGACFQRINVGCARSVLEEGLRRLVARRREIVAERRS